MRTNGLPSTQIKIVFVTGAILMASCQRSQQNAQSAVPSDAVSSTEAPSQTRTSIADTSAGTSVSDQETPQLEFIGALSDSFKETVRAVLQKSPKHGWLQATDTKILVDSEHRLFGYVADDTSLLPEEIKWHSNPVNYEKMTFHMAWWKWQRLRLQAFIDDVDKGSLTQKEYIRTDSYGQIIALKNRKTEDRLLFMKPPEGMMDTSWRLVYSPKDSDNVIEIGAECPVDPDAYSGASNPRKFCLDNSTAPFDVREKLVNFFRSME